MGKARAQNNTKSEFLFFLFARFLLDPIHIGSLSTASRWELPSLRYPSPGVSMGVDHGQGPGRCK